MPSFISIHGFEYEKKVLNAETTARDFDRRADRYSRENQSLSIEDRTKLKGYGPGYSAWMCRRRAGEYEDFAYAQEIHLHEVAISYSGRAVCVCGLVTNQKDFGREFLLEPGHIFAATQQLEHQFVLSELQQNQRLFFYFCQLCQLKMPAPKADGQVSLQGLAVFKAEHSACQPKQGLA